MGDSPTKNDVLLDGVTTLLPSIQTGVMEPSTLSTTAGMVQLAVAFVSFTDTTMVRSAGQVNTGAMLSTTVIVKVHEAELLL